MSQELFYTSAPMGLKPGSKGFCTVAMTAGMSGALVQRLELLSGYREIFPPGHPQYDMNPVAWSHWRISVGDRTSSLLSRICPAGMDYTQRANTFAHHIVLDPSEQSAGGPAWLMSQPGMMETAWDGSPRLLVRSRQIPTGEDTLSHCAGWEIAAGDPGWAGALAETALSDASSVAYIIYPPGLDTLPLIREAMSLLPPKQRWLTTFCTHFTDLPAGFNCSWRYCVAGTPAEKEARKYAVSGLVIDLTSREALTGETSLIKAARTGILPSPAVPAEMPALVHQASWRTDDGEAFVSSVSDRAYRSLQSLRDSSSDGYSDSPQTDSSTDGTDDHNPVPHVPNTPRPRTLFWLIAILWPLFLIPGVIMWHLMAESQAKRDLESHVRSLEAKIDTDGDTLAAAKQANNELLSSTARSNNARISELIATTQAEAARLDKVKGQINDAKSRYDKTILDQEDEIKRVKFEANADKENALAAARHDARQELDKVKDDLKARTDNYNYLNQQWIAATTQPALIWDGGLDSAQPTLRVIAPEGGQYKFNCIRPPDRKVNNKVIIQGPGGNEVGSIVLQDGPPKLEPTDVAAVKTDDFTNWLSLVSVQVYTDKGWTYFRFCSAPTIIENLGKSYSIPPYAATADPKFLTWRKAPQCDNNWQIEVSGNKIDCRLRDGHVLLSCDDGAISRRDILPKNFPDKFPPLVLDLIYEYRADVQTHSTPEPLKLCRVKITSPLGDR